MSTERFTSTFRTTGGTLQPFSFVLHAALAGPTKTPQSLLRQGVKPGHILAAFKQVAAQLGLKANHICLVDALFRFQQPQDWDSGSHPIVWPSTAHLQEYLGLGRSQTNALLRHLITNGFVLRQSSANGKRYGTRDAQGHIVQAYGFDLSPLALRFEEFKALAAKRCKERQQCQQKPGAIPAREAIHAPWCHDSDTTYRATKEEPINQNSYKADILVPPDPPAVERPTGGNNHTVQELPLTPKELVTLAPQLGACLTKVAPDWSDLVDAAERLGNHLGISHDLWGDACHTMGRERAATAMAIVSTKSPQYFTVSPGAYFRGMLERDRAGELNLPCSIAGLRATQSLESSLRPSGDLPINHSFY